MKQEYFFTVENGAEVMENINRLNELTKKAKSICKGLSWQILFENYALSPIFDGARVFVEIQGHARAQELINEVIAKIDTVAALSNEISKLQFKLNVLIQKK